MSLKTAIVSVLDREDLKRLLDALDIDGADRRNVQATRSALTGARQVSEDSRRARPGSGPTQKILKELGYEYGQGTAH